MIDEAEAGRLLLASLPETPAMRVDSCRLSVDGTHWILTANTIEFLRDGDLARALVGVGAYLVDAETGAVEALATHVPPDRELADRKARAEDGELAWMIRPVGLDPARVVRLRQFLACGPAEALALARRPVWFVADRRDATEAREVLAALGVPVAIERVAPDRAGLSAIPSLTRVTLDEPGLREALRRLIGAATARG